MSRSLGTLSLVIPCFNEELAVQPVLQGCLQMRAQMLAHQHFDSVEIIVVDDASTDLSAEIIGAFKEIRILRLPQRLGYGAALKAGFLEAKGQWLAMIDMDATYDPLDFMKALTFLEKDRDHIVMGDRLSRISGMPLTRKLGNHFFVSMIRFFHGKKVLDSCTGFRIFSRNWIFDFLRDLPNDLNFSLAMTLVMLQQDHSYTEIPICYASRRGRSKLNVVFHGFEFLWTILIAAIRPLKSSRLNSLEEHGILPAK